MVIVYTVVALVILLVTMFILGYRKSKRALDNKELSFRHELIEQIEDRHGIISDQQKEQITKLPGRQLTTYLQDNDLINHTTYNALLKRHFNSDKYWLDHL